MNEYANEMRHSRDELLKKEPSAERLTRTNYGADDQSIMNDNSATIFSHNYDKEKVGAIFN